MNQAARGRTWAYSLFRLLWTGLDWLFPPLCGGCGRLGARWCSDCQRRVSPILGLLCESCGLPADGPARCPACTLEPPEFSALRAWAVLQDPVQEALHKLKYRRDIGLGDALAAQLSGFVRELGWPVGAVVPVPLSTRRFGERGYNQVALIAFPLALALGLEYCPSALVRHAETRSQVGLNRQERRENVRGAFKGVGRLARGKSFLLVDDVATTGSTLSAAACALSAAGAQAVYALTVARALPRKTKVAKEAP